MATTAEAPAASIDPAELEKFSAMAAEWWDPAGKFRPLHKFNPVRIGFLRDTVAKHFARERTDRRVLDGLDCLDIGCGGGLMSEPMARLGARVTGIDALEKNIAIAATHAGEEGLAIDYLATSAEALADTGAQFDVVLNLEVVEHVADLASFLTASAQLVRPGGLMIIATINRTPKAFALAILGAERILRWLPRGTHQFEKLVRPGEIRDVLLPAGMRVRPPVGVSYAPLADAWKLSGDTAVNYMVVCEKPA